MSSSHYTNKTNLRSIQIEVVVISEPAREQNKIRGVGISLQHYSSQFTAGRVFVGIDSLEHPSGLSLSALAV